MQNTAIIRSRGQLTIPDKIRDRAAWTKPNSVVTISLTPNKELIIRPFTAEGKKVDWDRIWKGLYQVRSFKTKDKRPASELIAEDRYNH